MSIWRVRRTWIASGPPHQIALHLDRCRSGSALKHDLRPFRARQLGPLAWLQGKLKTRRRAGHGALRIGRLGKHEGQRALAVDGLEISDRMLGAEHVIDASGFADRSRASRRAGRWLQGISVEPACEDGRGGYQRAKTAQPFEVTTEVEVFRFSGFQAQGTNASPT